MKRNLDVKQKYLAHTRLVVYTLIDKKHEYEL